jgi:hypothetical protein
LKKSPVFVTTYVYVTDVFLSLHTFRISGVFVRLIVQTCPVTVAVAVAVACEPFVNVAVAVAIFTVVALIAADLVSVWLAPGANGPQLPIEPKWSSVNVPEALSTLPLLLVTTYVYVTDVFLPLHTFVIFGVFVRLIVQLVTVSVPVQPGETHPLLSVTTAVYVPALAACALVIVIVAVAALKPPGPLQRMVYGAVPPEGFTVKLGELPAHTESVGGVTEQVGE